LGAADLNIKLWNILYTANCTMELLKLNFTTFSNNILAVFKLFHARSDYIQGSDR
jgi:hypothetical protein